MAQCSWQARFSEHFWHQVQKDTECWEWTAATTPAGYGKLTFYGESLAAHRVSWELSNGPIPDGLWVLHRCDNPPCVRPEHLFLGTPRDNTLDMHLKGRAGIRGARGSRNAKAKLTEEDIIRIRDRFAAGEMIVSLAVEYVVSVASVSNIVNGRTWGHVGGPVRIDPPRGRRSTRKAS
jgi:hypothetical protein